jgi:cytochrome c oxidase subunit 2
MDCAGYNQPMLLASNSIQAAEVNTLFIWVTATCGSIFLIIGIGVIFCTRRFAAKPGETEEPHQTYGDRRLEWIWTIIPCLILIALGIATVRGMTRVLPERGTGKPDLIVTGHQWWWSIEYPEHGVITANEFLIPVGKKTLIDLESADVIHSFWPPDLCPKQDMIPGHPSHLWIEPTKTGTYIGVCAEFCGTQHANMRFEIRVVPQAEFDQWIAEQKKPASPSTTSKGAELFNSLACADCHRINGTSAAGVTAPDLTHFASRSRLASGTIPNTRENIERWLRDPDSIKPGSHMPDYKLSEEDITALTDYLSTLK